jgi:prenyltransferase beta subunit
VHKFGAGESLDLVHLSCLVRCRADLADLAGPPVVRASRLQCLRADLAGPRAAEPPYGAAAEDFRRAVLGRLESFRTSDGGYHHAGMGLSGSAYGCFLATGAYDDLGEAIPDPDRLPACLESLKTPDGAYANDREMPVGLTPVTAAAVAVLRRFGRPVEPGTIRWLRARLNPHDGGFLAVPDAPVSDLLSTATALHALAAAGESLDDFRRPCLDFLHGLWSETGSFRGSAFDDVPDCEYTWYGLLATGHLAGPE